MTIPASASQASCLPTSDRTATKNLLWPLAVAFLIRMVVVCLVYRGLPDADQFYEQFGWETGWVARSLASGHGFTSPFWPTSGPTAFVPPLYPFLLSLLFRLFGIYSLTAGFLILTLNSIFSTLTAVTVYWSADYSLGKRAARIAAWVWALYPFAIYFSAGRVWEYSLTAFLFSLCFCLAQRLGKMQSWTAWAGLGALFALSAYSSPAVLACFPFLLGYAMWQQRQQGWKTLARATTAGLVLVALMAPWVVRNQRALGIFCPMRDNFWLEFYAGNCLPHTPSETPSAPSPHPPSNPVEMQRYLAVGEVRFMDEKHQLAKVWLRQHPVEYLHSSVHRFVYYWTGYWSFTPEYLAIEPTEIPMIFYVTGMTLLMLRGGWRMVKWKRTEALPYLLVLGLFPAAYYLSLALIDHRMPIEPVIVVLAVAGALPLKSWNSTTRTGKAG